MQLRNLDLEGGLHVRRFEAAMAATGLIGCIGDAAFGQRGIEQLSRFLPVCWWSVYRLFDDAPPFLHVAGSIGAANVVADSWSVYRAGLYRRDHTFAIAHDALRSGRHVMTHLHATEVSPEHRKQIYLENGLSERISLARHDSASGTLCVNFYRHKNKRPFTDDELDDVQQVGALILSSVSRHVEFSGDTGQSPVLDGLPRREREVCDRLLRGMSHDGVAADLGLSVTTVRTYRDRAFTRLGIHHRSELFARVLSRPFHQQSRVTCNS